MIFFQLFLLGNMRFLVSKSPLPTIHKSKPKSFLLSFKIHDMICIVCKGGYLLLHVIPQGEKNEK